MNKQTIPNGHSEKPYEGENSQNSNEATHDNNQSTSFFRDNLQKQKEETKKNIEEKMKNTLKSGENKQMFFKDNPPQNIRKTNSGEDVVQE